MTRFVFDCPDGCQTDPPCRRLMMNKYKTKTAKPETGKAAWLGGSQKRLKKKNLINIIKEPL